MEKSLPNPQKLNINLKNRPPINPPIGNHHSIPGKFEKSRNPRYVSESVPLNLWQEMKPKPKSNGHIGTPTKPVSSDTIPEASLGSPDFREFSSDKENQMNREESWTCSCRHGSTGKGTPKRGAAKSLLFEICTANNWKSPFFECCEEEGPSHAKKFTFKVIVEMKGASSTVLECYGAPQARKKEAAEHAAEGALWYLKHLGYILKR